MRTNKLHVLFTGFLIISILMLMSCSQDKALEPSASAVQSEITLAKNSNIDAFDMNDRFGDPSSGAKGNGTVSVQNGQMDLTIHARGLIPGHAYEVHVAVGMLNQACSIFDPTTLARLDTYEVTGDKNGKLRFKIVGVNLGLASGQYRMDYVVVHGEGAHGGFVLACEPASCVTIP